MTVYRRYRFPIIVKFRGKLKLKCTAQLKRERGAILQRPSNAGRLTYAWIRKQRGRVKLTNISAAGKNRARKVRSSWRNINYSGTAIPTTKNNIDTREQSHDTLCERDLFIGRSFARTKFLSFRRDRLSWANFCAEPRRDAGGSSIYGRANGPKIPIVDFIKTRRRT